MPCPGRLDPLAGGLEMNDAETVTAASIEDAIRRLGEAPPERAVADLTAVANRAIIELHRVARAQANAHRGEAEWGRWARLANAVRSGVLQLAAIRDALKAFGPVADPRDPAAQATTPSEATDLPAESGGSR
jgi:hypothetical protein